MPIVESNSGNGFKGAISYSMQLEKLAEMDREEAPVFIECNGVYGSYAAMAHQMRWVAETQDFKKPVLHFRVNFSPGESRHLPVEKQVAAVKSILQGLGIDKNRQYIITQHNDKEHTHYHVIANKVDLDGEKMDITNFNYRATAQADRVEREMGLELTPNRTIFYSTERGIGFRYATAAEKAAMHLGGKLRPDRRDGVQKMKASLSAVIREVLADPQIVDADLFQKGLGDRGIEVRFMANKKGISGVSFHQKGLSANGTHLGLKWGVIAQALAKNKNEQLPVVTLKEKIHQQTVSFVRGKVEEALERSGDAATFHAALKKQSIHYEEGLGVTYQGKNSSEPELSGEEVRLSAEEVGISEQDLIRRWEANALLQKQREAAESREAVPSDKEQDVKKTAAIWADHVGVYQKLVKAVGNGQLFGKIDRLFTSGNTSYFLQAQYSGALELSFSKRKSAYSAFTPMGKLDLKDIGMQLDFNEAHYQKLSERSMEQYNTLLRNQGDMRSTVSDYMYRMVDQASFDKEGLRKNKDHAVAAVGELATASELLQKAGFSVEGDKVIRGGFEHSGNLALYQGVLEKFAQLLRGFYGKLKEWIELQKKPEEKISLLQLPGTKKEIRRRNENLRYQKSNALLPDVESMKKVMAMDTVAKPKELFTSVSEYNDWKISETLEVSAVKVDKGLCQQVGIAITAIAQHKQETEKKNDIQRKGGRKL